MDKETFVEQVSALPGVGKKKAEALYDAGYTDIEKVKAASIEELQQVEGIGPKVAQAIKEGLEPAAGKGEIEVVEAAKGAKAEKPEGKAKKAEPKAEVVEPEQAYRVRIKPELSEELKRALTIRAIHADRQPTFKRYHHWYAVRIPEAWRAPKGTLSKQRRGFKYRPPRVKVGYGKPAVTRGLHPTGFEEVLVANPDELGLITDPKTQAARIRGSVGGRKRGLIEAAAAERGIRVLNPRRT